MRKIWILIILSLILFLAGTTAVTVSRRWEPADVQGSSEAAETGAETESKPEISIEAEVPEEAETPEETEAPEEAETPEETEASEETEIPGEAKSWKEPETEATLISEEPEPYAPPVIVWASDIHYMSPSMTDYGQKFQETVALDDGKIIGYTPQLVDAFIEEVIELSPAALVLGGDVTFNGERQNHLELAEKLKKVQAAGIQVLMLPGNHDLNNPHAASYEGTEKTAAESIDAAGFYEIYHGFGYDQALSRDPASLSYIYELDERNWMLLLDSCQYENGNEVGGRIREETYDWMTKQLTEAASRGITIIPTAHHNLMDESRLYTTDCTLEENERLISLLESWRAPVYLSGHLHLQRMRKHETGDAYGIYEIVGGSFAMPPCQYGILRWNEDGSLTYETKEVDVPAWAERNGIQDENLLNFSEYQERFLRETVGAKMNRKDLQYLPEHQEEAMEELYVKAYEDYSSGIEIDMGQLEEGQNYWMWERNRPDSESRKKLDIMIGDSYSDNRTLTIPAPGTAPF